MFHLPLARCSRIGLFFRLCLETFKFHFNNIRALLAVQAAEVHVFDVAVSRKPRRDSVLFRPVRKAQDAPPITVKPTVGGTALYPCLPHDFIFRDAIYL